MSSQRGEEVEVEEKTNKSKHPQTLNSNKSCIQGSLSVHF